MGDNYFIVVIVAVYFLLDHYEDNKQPRRKRRASKPRLVIVAAFLQHLLMRFSRQYRLLIRTYKRKNAGAVFLFPTTKITY